MKTYFKNACTLLIVFSGFFFGQVANGQNKTINVNLYANNDPYNNSQWNNQLITQPAYPFTSGAYNYSDGSVSAIYSTISASQTPTSTSYADNGAGYATTMCPSEVGRYASYWPSTRTITFKGLNNAKFYTIQLYCSRNTSQGTTRNTINGVIVDIGVYNNFTNIATYSNIVPSGGQIILTQTTLNNYVYLNGFTITEKTTAGNQSPAANAGSSQTITLPTSQVTLTGSGTDADGTIASYAWTQVSGTAATIANPAAASTNITGLTTAGARVFRLTVTDNQGATGTSDVTVTVNAAANQSPVANAGSGQTITLPVSQVTLTGGGTDTDGTIASYAWTQVSGTAATIASPSAASTNITGLTTAGARVFRLTVTDNQGATGTGDVTVTVNAAANQSPVANAGSGQTITLPVSQVTLTGSGTDTDGTIASYAWTQVSGTAATIASPSAASTNITGLTTAGARVFRLMVTDNQGATGTSNVTITVNSAANQPPAANAGSSQTITLPVSQVTLTGSGTDTDGTIASYAWTQLSGTAATIANPSSASTNITGLTTAGIRVFRLTVTDNQGATGTGDVTITVNTSGALPVITTNNPQAISTTTASLTSSGSAGAGIASTKWTKFSVPGQAIKTVTVIGSSTAAGNGTTSSDSAFVNRLKAYYISQGIITGITNLAVAGTTPFDINITTALNYNSDILLVSYPSNGYTALQNANVLARLQMFKDSATARGKQFYITGTQPRNDFNPADKANLVVLNDSLRNRFGARFIDLLTPLLNTTDNTMKTEYNADGIHPNNAGHRIIYDRMRAANIFQNTISSASIISNPASANTNITGLTLGVHQFQVSIVDNAGFAASAVAKITINSLLNQPPVAIAGADQTITLPVNVVSLSGTASSDDHAIISYQWTKLSGTGGTLTTPTASTTTFTGLSQGIYKVELRITDDSSAVSRDTVQVTVNFAPNTAPVAIAGADQTITLPANAVSLSGVASTDDHAIVSYQWTKLSGTGGTLTTPTASTTTFTGLSQGIYKIELRVTDDSSAVSRDTVQITVNFPPNTAPVAKAGADQTISLPVNAVSLNGAASTDDHTIVSYQWTKLTGTGGTLISPTASTTMFTGLSLGIYTVELRVTDDSSAIARDTVQVKVTGSSILDPSDSVITYNPAAPPTQPQIGQIGKWVRTVRMTWNTDSWKPYILNSMAFRLKFPKTYNPAANDGKRYPVIIFMHGLGEVGITGVNYDNEFSLANGGPIFTSAVDNGTFDGYVLVAQAPPGGWVSSHFANMVQIVDYLVANNKADPFQVILNGLSNGGHPCWETTNFKPSCIAARLPMSGVNLGDIPDTSKLKFTPIWDFQGGLDVSPDPYTASQVKTAYDAAGANLKYTLYPTLGHGTWSTAWAEPDFFPFINRAYSSNPWPLFGRTEFCPNDPINVTVGVAPGFDGYQWRKDSVIIPGATANTIVATQTGKYDARVLKGSLWSDWSRTPVIIKIKAATITPPITVSGLMSRVIPALDTNRVTLKVPAGYVAYTWQKSGNNTTISTDSTLNVTTPGDYIVKVTEQYGCSSNFSSPFTVIDVNGPNKPDAPTSLSISTVSKTSLRLDWSQNPAPQYNETNFEIYQSLQPGGSYKLIAITGADVSSYVVTGLSFAGTKYYYKLRAVNNTGASAASNEVSGTTDIDTQPPTAPVGLAVSGTTRSAVFLTWGAATDEVGVVAYDIYVEGIRSYTTTQTQFMVNALNYGQSYNFTVKARDFAGNVSVASNQVTAQPLLAGLNYKQYTFTGTWNSLPDFNSLTPVATGNMSNVAITPRTQNDNFAFLWQGYISIPTTGIYYFRTNSDDGSKLYLGALDGIASPYSYGGAAMVDNDGVHGATDATSVAQTLTAGVYPIAVTFYEQGGSEAMTVSWRTPSTGTGYVTIPDNAFTDGAVINGSAPSAPSNLTATTASYKRINLNWADNSNNETGFEIWRSTSASTGFNTVAMSAANATSFGDSSVLNGATTYYYKIRAIGDYGESAFSGIASATTSTLPAVPVTPGNLVATGINSSAVNITWAQPLQPPAADAGSPQIITLPTSQVILTGSGTANNGGTINSYSWTQVSGAAATITGASSATTNITGLTTAGVRVFRLTVTDNSGGTGTGDVTITVNSATGSPTPYGGTRRTIPGKLEAEDYDNGGQNIAYFDGTNSNSGGAYRLAEYVDLGNSGDTGGGYRIGWTTDGEWVKYSVKVITTGTYTFTARIATPNTGKSIQFQVDGTVAGTLTVPNTGGWTTWQTATLNNVSLSAGDHTFRFLLNTGDAISDASGFDINWFNFALVSATTPAGSAPISNYELYRSANNNTNYLLLASLPVNTTSYTDSSLFANASYYYKVRGVNVGGPSVYSNEDSALTANHAPVIIKLSNKTVRYGITTVIPVTATDTDAGTLSFTIQNKPVFATFIDNGNRSATLTLNPAISDQNSYNNIRIIVNDANGGRDTTIFNLTVNDNYDPVIASIADYTMNENDSLNIALTATDQNAADILTWSVNNLPNVFTLTSGVNGAAVLKLKPTYAAAGVYTVQVNVSDGKGGTSTRQFTLTVNDKDPNTKIYTRIKYANNIGTPWNNITGITTANLKDEFNNTTTVGLNFQQSWWLPYNAGPVTGNNSGIYPDAVLNDFWYFGYYGGPETASIAVTGLIPSKKYNLSFYAGSVFNGVTSNGTTTYTVGTQTVSLSVQNNTQNTVSINNITPAANGSITVNMAKAANTQIGYLNALVVTALYDDGTAPAAPKMLAAQNVSGQGVKLTWQDVAYNETGYEVYRSLSAAGTFALVGTAQTNAVDYTDGSVSGATPYYYKLRAINSIGASAYTNVISITTTNRIPQISPISDVVVMSNQSTPVNVTATDDATDHIRLTASGLPSFATFVDNGNGTGVVNIQPTASSLGTYPGITITAKDNSDSSRSVSFSIYVVDANLSSTYVNITDLNNPAPAPWNNMTIGYLPYAATAISNLKDDRNINTGISVTLTDAWQAVSSTGMRRRNGSELYPESVSRSGIYFTDTATHRITVSGLNPAKKYNFVFYSSHSTSESTLTNFAISSQTVSLNGCHNSNKTVQINGIVPAANGQVTINVTKNASAISGLLSALVIQSYTPGVVSTFGPADLRVLDYSATNTVSLQWQDRADNETGYEVWRANDGGSYSLLTTLAANSTSYVNTGLTSNTTYNYIVRAKNGTAFSSYSNAVKGYTYASTVFINVNTNSVAGSPWNNLNWTYGVGAVWNNFRNDAGIPTNIGMVQPVKIDGMVTPGVNTGNNSGVFPDAVLAESFGLFPGLSSYIKLTGLELSKVYDITLTASISGIYGDNSTAYTINGKTCLLNSIMNKDGTLTMFGIVPDQNGEVTISFTGYPGATFGLLGALVVKGHDLSVVAAPVIPAGAVNGVNSLLTEVMLQQTQVVAQESGAITAYPNPFNQYISLSVPAANKENIRVQISDVNGRLIYEKQYNDLVQGNNIIRIETGKNVMPPGMYLVKVINLNKGDQKTIKIIKQQ